MNLYFTDRSRIISPKSVRNALSYLGSKIPAIASLLLLPHFAHCAAPVRTPDVLKMQPTQRREPTYAPIVSPTNPALTSNPAPGYFPSNITPPPVTREFRAAWISSVGENSWLAQLTGKSTAEQKATLGAMLDRAVQLKLNAIIFQVRPSCDVLYESPFEPWSEYLTGKMGRAPQPFYDPLAFMVEEAHKRGLELHAWFNPYRAHHADAKSPIAPNHVSRAHPEYVRTYGKYLWLDPGERNVQDYSLGVVMDVVKRYDIDGVHFDDYFYPYREKDPGGHPISFPDDASWKKFGANGPLARDDWRRENVNTFIQRVYSSIKATKPWVKFGIAPFGIWRPGNPAQIRGKDAYAELYGDTRKWIANGWADYFSPQLYWNIENKEQSFPVLLKWWSEQNLKGRHLWPGLDATKVDNDKWKPDEIAQQIRYSRQLNPPGQIFWGMHNLMPGQSRLAEKLAREIYTSPALVPASPWMSSKTPGAPVFFMSGLQSGKLRVLCSPAEGSRPRLWVWQIKSGSNWSTEFIPGGTLGRMLGDIHPDAIAVTEIDRFGKASRPIVWEKTKTELRRPTFN